MTDNDQQPDVPRFQKYRHEDNMALRKKIETALFQAVADVLGRKIVILVKSSSLSHTDLLPKGDMFTINVVLEAYEADSPKNE